MKMIRNTRPLILSAVVLAGATRGWAANVVSTWNNAASANWNVAGNWSPSGVPSSSVNTELTFAGSTVYTASNNVPSPPFVLNKLNFSDTAAATVNGSPLSFSTNSDGVGPQIVAGTTFNHNIFTSGMVLNANMTFSGLSTGTLSVSSPMTGGAVSVTQTGTYNLTLSGDNSAITGGLFVKRGTVQITATAGNFRGSDVTINSGGALALGSNSTNTAVADRLGDTKTVSLAGGDFRLNGQAFSGSIQNASETISTLALAKGYSTITTNTGNALTSGTTLTSSLSRTAGTTLFARGGSLGGASGTQKILFTNSQTGFLKGAGGTGSQISIYPFMVADSANAFASSSANFATYDANGVRALNTTTEYTANLTTATATDNVAAGTSVNISVDKTINSLRVTGGTSNITDGTNARVLTVASGAVAFANTNNNIGTSTGPAGTLNFGATEGFIFTIGSNTNTIRSNITGSAGLTKGGTGTLVLGGANGYTGVTSISGGTIQVGEGTAGSGATTTTGAKLGAGNVEIADGATMLIRQGVLDAIDNLSSVTLRNDGIFFGRMNLESGINETVYTLTLGPVTQAVGTYGSTASAATFKDDNYFSGTGILNVVAIPEPTTAAAFLGVVGMFACTRRVRTDTRSDRA